MRARTRLTAAAVTVAAVGALPAAFAPPAQARSQAPCPATTGRPITDTPATFPRTVALTFDDGPNPEFTPGVLAVLRKHGVHATFFVVGTRAAQHPALLKQVSADGNVIGNHTWTHPTAGNGFSALDRQQVGAEIGRTTQLIQHLTNRRVCFFRAPQGKDKTAPVRQITEKRDLTVTNMHSAHDYLQPAKVDPAWVSLITDRLVGQGNHPILLLHDGGRYRENSVLALDRIITWYQKRGYVFTDPAGRPFPADLPAGGTVPSTGWALPPDPAAPDGGAGATTATDGTAGAPEQQPGTVGAQRSTARSEFELHQAGMAIGSRPAGGDAVPI